MEITGNNLGQARKSRLEAFSVAAHSCCRQVICLSALLWVVLPFSAAVASEGPDSPASRRAGEPGALLTTLRRHDQVSRQLWGSRVTLPQPSVDSSKAAGSGKEDLERMIELVRSVKFKRLKVPERVIVLERARSIEPNVASRPVAPSSQPAKSQATAPTISPRRLPDVNVLPYEPVSDQTLRMLTGLLGHPEALSDPLGLAEILFLSARLKEAVMCYQEALSRSNRDDPATAKDRAWILFQIGNCLQSDDPKKAIETYRRLVAEHPDSAWTELAKAREKLIEWRQRDFPQITDSKSLVEHSEEP